jgi:hypothetical protein
VKERPGTAGGISLLTVRPDAVVTMLPNLPESVCVGRRYRLVDLCGRPHAEADLLFDSYEAARDEALRWDLEPASITIEVSTVCGSWRNLGLPQTA